MSTNAVIFCKNSEGTFDGISVHFDGYIDNGVGEQLLTYWTNNEDIRKLCGTKKQIRSFGDSFNEIEFFDDDLNPICRKQIKALKGLTFVQMNNACHQYNYAYFWDVIDDTGKYEWMLYRDYYTFKPVSVVLDQCRPSINA